MWFGIASKKELSKELDKISKAFKERDEKIEKLNENIQNNSLKIATLEGVLLNKAQAQVSVSSQSQGSLKAVSGKSQPYFESKLIQRIRNNKKSLVMAEIMKLLPSHTTIETFDIIVLERKLCSKASFYRYLDSLKSQKLMSQETKTRLN